MVNYRDSDYVGELRAGQPTGFDRIIDVAFGSNLTATTELLASNGVLVVYASEATDPVVPVRTLMTLNTTVRFVLVYNLTPSAIEAAVRDVSRALDAGALEALPASILPLADISDAHRAAEAGTFGRVLLEVSPQ